MRLLLFFALIDFLQSCHGSTEEEEALTALLEDTDKSITRVFKLRDNKGQGMDCLDVFQAKATKDGSHLGISHSLKDGVFSIHLSKSNDLKKWQHLIELDQHASQATVHETKHGSFLLAYEKDSPNSCWIRLRSYPDLKALRTGKHDREIDLPRTLAPTAEGTPSFESVECRNGNLAKSKIQLRFHYFERARVDQLASGTLTDFMAWEAKPAKKLNDSFVGLGGNGNIGDRSKFIWKGRSYFLQEVQETRRDWGSWGLFLCDSKGFPLKRLRIKTPEKSLAFSNPAVSRIKDQNGKELLVFTSFIHNRGSSPNEAGQMLLSFAAE